MIRFLDSSNTQIIFSCVVSQQGTFTKRKYLKTYRRPLPTRPDHARVNTERQTYLSMHACTPDTSTRVLLHEKDK